jgi:serine protease
MRLQTLTWLLTTVLATGALGQTSDVVFKTARSGPASPSEQAWREGEVIVAFHQEIDIGSVEQRLRSGGAVAARPARLGSVYLVSLEPGVAVPDAVSHYRRMEGVDYAEPNGILRKSQGSTFTPDDEFFDFQWNMELVDAERTWAIQQGQSSVGVAVLDTGVAYEDYTDPVTGQVFAKAPDWGDVRFLPGFDAVNNDSHPNDDEWHGTHVASTIAEGTNNAIDLTGLAFGCAIMPVKVLDDLGEGTFFDVAAGIDYAASYTEGGERPVKVINMSLGTEGFSETVKRAVDRAHANGVVLVAAAGNTGSPGVDFPARLENVIAVGAVDARGERASYSSRGPELDLMAPGGDCDRDDNSDDFGDCVFQQMPDFDFVAEGIYTQFCLCGLDGTSMAAPHVSAAAALLISQGITEPEDVQAALEQTAEKISGAPPDGRNDEVGYGLIQPAAALSGLGFNQGPVR